MPFENLGYARVDHHREVRQGVPEVVLAQGKTFGQREGILRSLISSSQRAVATRVEPEVARSMIVSLGEGEYFETARLLVIDREPLPRRHGVGIVTAGTSDIPVAEEAAVTAEIMGNEVKRIYDVGVAGLHRLLGSLSDLRKCNALVVAAGMEGALPSVIGGLVSVPVIAVPTSVGYGASFGGLAALLGMLNSCATGVAVVNIDNGFGAGVIAGMINTQGPR